MCGVSLIPRICTDLGTKPVTHCGMDKIVVDLSVHAVIHQTSLGSARSFLSQLLTTWSSASVGMRTLATRILPLTLFNSTYSELATCILSVILRVHDSKLSINSPI